MSDQRVDEYIRKEVSPFIDPASELTIIDSKLGYEFRFFRNAIEYQGTAWSETSENISVRLTCAANGRQFKNLRSFLASGDVADLTGMCRLQRAILSKEAVDKRWVDTESQIGDVNQNWGAPVSSEQAMSEFIKSSATNQTKVLVVDGPAGIGKSWLLNKFCMDQAISVGNGHAATPMLIVSSMGRRLSRLNDAIAASAQDVKAKFSYWEVAPLVRHQALILAIDGFDELAYSEGYKDAWASLESLLTELDGKGSLIIAARDTFIHDQKLPSVFKRAQELRHETLLIQYLNLLPWQKPQVRVFLQRTEPVLSTEQINAVLDLMQDGGMPLLKRPVFVKELANHLAMDGTLENAGYKRFLIDKFVEREAHRVFTAQAQNGPVKVQIRVESDQIELLTQFFKELAGEMFAQETQAVDTDVIRTYLEIFLEQYKPSSLDRVLTPETTRAILHRASSIGFMDRVTDGGRERRRFPHEVVFWYFLSEYLIDELKDKERFEWFLRRGLLSLDMRDSLVEALERRQQDDKSFSIRENIQWALKILPTVRYMGALHTNLGAFLMSLMSTNGAAELSTVEITEQMLDAVSLAFARCAMKLQDCQIRLLDASSADLSRVEFERVNIERMRVDEYTSLGSTLPNITRCLEVTTSRQSETIWEQSRIHAKLEQLMRDRPHASNEQPSAGERLLYKLARLWTRAFFLDPSEGDKRFFQDPAWPQLYNVLNEHKRLRVERSHQMSGQNRPLLRLKDPVAVLMRRHEDPDIQRQIDLLWSDVHNIN